MEDKLVLLFFRRNIQRRVEVQLDVHCIECIVESAPSEVNVGHVEVAFIIDPIKVGIHVDVHDCVVDLCQV